MAAPELFQFRMSHFNEKGRWALDWKGLAHVRHSLVPGPHRRRMQRLSGQPMVPVLRDGDTVVAGSAQIIAHLEAARPDPPLYPADQADRRRALEIARRFDEEVGPAIRLALFHDLFQAGTYFARVFTWDHGPVVRLAYRAILPGVRRLVVGQYGITADTARAARARTREALDFVTREVGPDGYLAGNRFSVADLTAAALLSPATNPPESPIRYPEPWPRALTDWWAEWAAHPGVLWVRAMYQRHRGRSHEIAA